MQKLIEKAIKHYNYSSEVNKSLCDNDFKRKYKNFTDKDTLKNFTHVIYGVLTGNPYCTHIMAKNLLFQGNDDCWKYFERTAVFWTYGHLKNDIWIDHLKRVYEYALYIERKDLLEILFEISLNHLSDKTNLSNQEFKNQKVYPSTQLIHFLIDKWLGNNPVKELTLNYGEGYGIYQNIIDNWDDFSKINPGYWDDLCNYHLNGIGLQRGEKWENEEFLWSGLIPMELINLIKVRKKLGLEVPEINNELFNTNMAKTPTIPTGYYEKYDLKFNLIELTVQTKKRYTIQEIEEKIKRQNTGDIELFY